MHPNPLLISRPGSPHLQMLLLPMQITQAAQAMAQSGVPPSTWAWMHQSDDPIDRRIARAADGLLKDMA